MAPKAHFPGMEYSDLDIVVARLVGYSDIEKNDYGYVIGKPRGNPSLRYLPRFSSNVSEALELCEYMNTKGYMYSQSRIAEPMKAQGAPEYTYHVAFYNDETGVSGAANSHSLAEAICRAVLDALREEDLHAESEEHGEEPCSCCDKTCPAETPAIVEIDDNLYVVAAITKVTNVRHVQDSSGESRFVFYVHSLADKEPCLLAFNTRQAANSAKSEITEALYAYYQDSLCRSC